MEHESLNEAMSMGMMMMSGKMPMDKEHMQEMMAMLKKHSMEMSGGKKMMNKEEVKRHT